MSEPTRRRYDSPRRREQADATHARIVDAACELLAASSIRDWQGITVRAVAERAGVSERTVFRHFGNERGIRDATMRRLEAQAGIDLEHLELADLPKVIARVVEQIAAHPLEPKGTLDPTLSEVNRRQHAGLLAAVGAVADDWPEADRTVAAAVLDVLWGVATYERLAVDWGLDPDRAVAGITWLATLVEEAVRTGRRPLAD